MALSIDLRERILAAYDKGGVSREQVAERFAVSLGMVKKLLQQRRRIGDIGPQHHRAGRKPLLADEHRARLKAMLAERCDMTLAQLREGLGRAFSVSTIHRALAQMDQTLKKRPCGPANRTAKTSGSSAASGAAKRPRSTRSGSSSSTRRARRRT